MVKATAYPDTYSASRGGYEDKDSEVAAMKNFRRDMATIKATPEMSKARPVVPSIAPPANSLAAKPATGAEMRGAQASLQGALPQPILQQQAQNNARAAVQATQPPVGMDTTQSMESRNQSFMDAGVGAARFDQGPSGTGPVRGLVANTPVATGPVAAGFAGTGVGSPASATGARIRGGPNAVMTDPFVPQMTPEQAQKQMIDDQAAGKRVAVDKRYVDGIKAQNKAQDERIANRIAGIGQEGIIGRMNANYSADRLARDNARQVRGQEDRFARASLSSALTDPDPRVRAAALEASGQSNERYAKAAAPTGGFSGARDQLRNEQFAKDQLASQERVAQSAAEAKSMPAKINAEQKALDRAVRVDEFDKNFDAAQKKFADDIGRREKSANSDLLIARANSLIELGKNTADAKQKKDYIDKAASLLDTDSAGESQWFADASKMIEDARKVMPTNPAKPVDNGAQGGTMTPDAARKLMGSIKSEHPTWTQDQIRAEARRRSGA